MLKRQLLARKRGLLLVCLAIMIIAAVEVASGKIFCRCKHLEKEIQIAELKLGKSISISEQSGELESEYKKYITDLPGIKNSNNFIRQIQEFAQAVNFNIQNIKPLETKDEALYKKYSVYIEAQDEIFTLARFLDAFRDLKVVTVDSLKIRRLSRKENPEIKLLLSIIDFKS